MSTQMNVSEQTFEQEVLKAELPVLVDFWAAWCGPCRLIAPVVEQLADEYTGRIKVAKVDVDENAELANRYGIMSIPTLAVFVGGQPVSRIVGYVPRTEIRRHLDAALRGSQGKIVAARS